MDAATTCRFLFTNVVWPKNCLFIPVGGLRVFLLQNLRFKVFLVMTAIFDDALAMNTIEVFAPGQREEMRCRVGDIVQHMNQFCRSYSAVSVPGESAWMFHVILVLIQVVGFDGDKQRAKTNGFPGCAVQTERHAAEAQATSFLNAALSTFIQEKRVVFVNAALDYEDYDPHGRITRFFDRRIPPSNLPPIPVVGENPEASVLIEILNELRWPAEVHRMNTPLPSAATSDEACDAEVVVPPPSNTAAPTQTEGPLSDGFTPAVRAFSGRTALQKFHAVCVPNRDIPNPGDLPEKSVHIPQLESLALMGRNSGAKSEKYSGGKNVVDNVGSSLREIRSPDTPGWPHKALDTEWKPATSVAEFIRKRLRPAAFFLQKTILGDEGIAGAPQNISPEEVDEIRCSVSMLLTAVLSLVWCRLRVLAALEEGASVSFQDTIVPAQATRAFELAMTFSYFCPPTRFDEVLALKLMRSLITGFLVTGRAMVIANGKARDFPEYDSIGNLAETAPDFEFPTMD
ncbi:hypothetical protein DFH09DRAFT_1080694 [Mycena vulgaris]|nr:hypothetical protein DFH09DRAFT_1080694 [Mycena vulgaris]